MVDSVAQYGSDFSCLTGIDPLLRLVSGTPLMCQVAFRRLYCRQGGLWSDPDQVTVDVRDFVGAGIVPARDLPRISQRCEAALLGDERIFSATVLASMGGPGGHSLILEATGVGSQGPFALVLQVTALTVSVLRNS